VAKYAARYQCPYIIQHIAWTARLFERFLETGELRKT
jgi:hypothetical protein